MPLCLFLLALVLSAWPPSGVQSIFINRCRSAVPRVCDFVCDCRDCSDENQCGYHKESSMLGTPFTCDFEEGNCGWKDVSTSAYRWVTDQASIAAWGTGPRADHTLGTNLGWYMAAEIRRSVFAAFARLRSPVMRQAAATCEIRAWYHLWGTGLNKTVQPALWVELMSDKETIMLWQNPESSISAWQELVAYTGRVQGEFQITFSSQQSSWQLDDVEFRSCGLPPPLNLPCGPDKWRCNRGSCVHLEQLCDGTDDCGDLSDESTPACRLVWLGGVEEGSAPALSAAKAEGTEPGTALLIPTPREAPALACSTKPSPHAASFLRLGSFTVCSFEEDWCGWSAGPNGPSWLRNSSLHLTPGARRPSRGHSTNSRTGFFLYVSTAPPDLSSGAARLISPTFQATTTNSCSLVFYSYLYGSATSSLNIYYQTNSTMGLVHTWAADRGDYWFRNKVDFSVTERFQILLEAVIGAGHKGSVALDDLVLSPGCLQATGNLTITPGPASPGPTTPCAPEEFACDNEKCIRPELACDFTDTCEDGSDETSCGASTFEAGAGGWKDISVGQLQWVRENGSTASEPRADHTTNSSAGHYLGVGLAPGQMLSVARARTPPLGSSGLACSLEMHYWLHSDPQGFLALSILDPGLGTHRLAWHMQGTDSTAWKHVTVPLGKRVRPFQLELTALVKLRGLVMQSAAVDDIVFVNCDPHFTPPDASELSCNFERGLCGWYQDQSDDFEWMRGLGSDHTTGTGYFLAVDLAAQSARGLSARLITYPQDCPTREQCLSFWYRLDGPQSGTLSLKIQHDEEPETVLWTRTGAHGSTWHLGFATLRCQALQGYRGRLAALPCKPHEERGAWLLCRASPMRNGAPGCFAMHLGPGPHVPGPWAPQHLRSIPRGCGRPGEWVLGVVLSTACLPPWQLVFEALRSGYLGDIALDDVTMRAGACGPQESCSFEANACGFSSSWQYLWARQSNATGTATAGPPTDHTLGTARGYYMIVDTSKGSLPHGQTATLSSGQYRPLTHPRCLCFWYQLSPSDPGSLTVHVEEKGLQRSLFSVSSVHGDAWHRGQVTVQTAEAWKVVFKAVGAGGQLSYIALDDLHLQASSCPEPGSCDFESDTCGWTSPSDPTVGSYAWGWRSGISLGPEVDHTLGTTAGHYAYFDASVLAPGGHVAWLLSEHLPATAGACLWFWYHMDFQEHFDSSELRVKLSSTVGQLMVWRTHGHQGHGWWNRSIPVQSAVEFQICHPPHQTSSSSLHLTQATEGGGQGRALEKGQDQTGALLCFVQSWQPYSGAQGSPSRLHTLSWVVCSPVSLPLEPPHAGANISLQGDVSSPLLLLCTEPQGGSPPTLQIVFEVASGAGPAGGTIAVDDITYRTGVGCRGDGLGQMEDGKPTNGSVAALVIGTLLAIVLLLLLAASTCYWQQQRGAAGRILEERGISQGFDNITFRDDMVTITPLPGDGEAEPDISLPL
nr:apical endosomal glycoprotein [Pelodiscus sinensis]|eukprot:XP_025046305.1 apical endosomal glycoprotein [Pelodiscus sinensis]